MHSNYLNRVWFLFIIFIHNIYNLFIITEDSYLNQRIFFLNVMLSLCLYFEEEIILHSIIVRNLVLSTRIIIFVNRLEWPMRIYSKKHHRCEYHNPISWRVIWKPNERKQDTWAIRAMRSSLLRDQLSQGLARGFLRLSSLPPPPQPIIIVYTPFPLLCFTSRHLPRYLSLSLSDVFNGSPTGV